MVFFKKRNKLLLKCLPLMMLYLIFNIRFDVSHVRWAH